MFSLIRGRADLGAEVFKMFGCVFTYRSAAAADAFAACVVFVRCAVPPISESQEKSLSLCVHKNSTKYHLGFSHPCVCHCVRISYARVSVGPYSTRYDGFMQIEKHTDTCAHMQACIAHVHICASKPARQTHIIIMSVCDCGGRCCCCRLCRVVY